MKYFVDSKGIEYAGEGDILYVNILEPSAGSVTINETNSYLVEESITSARNARILANSAEITALNWKIAAFSAEIQKLVNCTAFLANRNCLLNK